MSADDETDPDVEQLRDKAAEDLDVLQRSLSDKLNADGTDLTDATRAATVIRQIIADRRQLLGLDTRLPRSEPRHLIQPGLTLPA